MKFFLALIFLLLLSEWSGSQPISRRENIPKDTVITMERTVCYGTCPHYKLTIYADGKVVFEGRDFVKKKGRFESHIASQQVEQLLTEFERANFFALRNSYATEADGCESLWTDHPTTTTSIKTNGKTKTVAHYHGCQGAKIPQSLTALENRIDEIVNTAQWIK
ncbi:MAG: hypothetical protein HY231_15600 [Acidobacteria bacterium]|nr:hypothetical protein [Acidobacteriota bacterium]